MILDFLRQKVDPSVAQEKNCWKLFLTFLRKFCKLQTAENWKKKRLPTSFLCIKSSPHYFFTLLPRLISDARTNILQFAQFTVYSESDCRSFFGGGVSVTEKHVCYWNRNVQGTCSVSGYLGSGEMRDISSDPRGMWLTGWYENVILKLLLHFYHS